MNILTLVCIIMPMSSLADDFFNNMTVADGTPNLLDVSDADQRGVSSYVFRITKSTRFYGNSKYIKQATSANANMQKDFTVMAWVKPQTRTTNWCRIVGKGSQKGQRNWGLWLSREGWPLSQVGCVSTGNNAWRRAGPKVPLRVWTHLTGIFRKNGLHGVYINGKLISQVNTKGTPCYTPSQPVTIGGLSGYQTFIGEIKDVRLYSFDIDWRKIPAYAGITSPTPRPTPRPTTRAPTTRAPTPSPTPSPTMNDYSTIIQLLNALISEGNSEISGLQLRIQKLNSSVEDQKAIFTTALRREEAAFEKKSKAQRSWAKAVGVAEATCKRTSETVPGLEDEIALFKKVINLLEKLSNGKELVAEDQIKVRSFISLADQADPTKVKKVIALVKGLITTAEADIAEARKACRTAQAAAEAAQKIYAKATGVWQTAVTDRKLQKARLTSAQAQLSSAERHASIRIPIVRSEIADLEKVLGLIKSLE